MMSIHFLRQWLPVVFGCLVLCCCNSKQSAEDAAAQAHDLPQIQAQGELTALTLYSSVSYFNYRGEPMGFQYELGEQFAASIGVKLTVKTADSPESLVRMLLNGEGDLILYNLNMTHERKDSLLFCGEESLTSQILVQRAGRQALKDVTELPGKEVYVKPGRYLQRLVNLDQELGGGIRIHSIPADSISEEDLIEQVALGQIDFTVSDNEIAKVNRTYFPHLDTNLAISFLQRSSWAVRRDQPLLAQAANEWFKQNKSSSGYRASTKRYFEMSKRINHGSILSASESRISRFDDLFKRYAPTIGKGWDWKLLASLAYAESNFDPNVVSWAGARGLMQLMPRTAHNFGVPIGKEADPEESIKAACKYLTRLDENFRTAVPDDNERIRFMLASYNAGDAHVRDAIALTRKYGGNPAVWEDEVEKYFKLKSHEKYFSDPVCRYGYFRGEETCIFVRDILTRYHLYQDKIKD